MNEDDFILAVARLLEPAASVEAAWGIFASRMADAYQASGGRLSQTRPWSLPDDQHLAAFAIRTAFYRRALENRDVTMNPVGSPTWPRALSELLEFPDGDLTVLDLCGGSGQASSALILALLPLLERRTVRIIIADHPNMMVALQPLRFNYIDPILANAARSTSTTLSIEYADLALEREDLQAELRQLGALRPNIVLHFHAGGALATSRPNLPSSSAYGAGLHSAFSDAWLLVHEMLPGAYAHDDSRRAWCNGIRDRLAPRVVYPCPRSDCSCPLGSEQRPRFWGVMPIREMCRPLAFNGERRPSEPRLFWMLCAPTGTRENTHSLLGPGHRQGTTLRWTRKSKTLGLCVPTDGELRLESP